MNYALIEFWMNKNEKETVMGRIVSKPPPAIEDPPVLEVSPF